MLKGHKTGKKATFRLRCQMILLSDQGRKIDQIADILCCNRQSVVKWFNRYERLGIDGLHTAQGPGRPPIVRIDNRKQIDQIECIVEQHPQKLNLARAQIELALGRPISQRSLRRLLKKRLALEAIPPSACQTTLPGGGESRPGSSPTAVLVGFAGLH